MPVEAPKGGRITDAKVHSLMKDYGGSSHRHLSYGEMGTRDIVLVEGGFSPYIVKKKSAVPDRKELDIARLGMEDYEVGVLRILVGHIDTAPVAIPTVIEEDRLSGLFVTEYMPGKTLTDMQVSAMKPSEKRALGTKLAQYVHWFAQAIPLNNPEFNMLYQGVAKPGDKRAALLDDLSISSQDLENVGQYTLADVREEQVREYMRLYNSGRITRRTIVGHNDLKPSNFVFNNDPNGDMALTSIIDYEQAISTTPEQEFRLTPANG